MLPSVERRSSPKGVFFYCTKNAMKEKKYFKSKQQELKVNKLFQSHHNDVERERRLSVVVEGENLNKLL